MSRPRRTTAEPGYAATCDRCPFQSTGAPLTVAAAGRGHEVGSAGHQVTVWDTDTSQLPRALWPQART